MKKILFAAVASTAFIASPAFAQATDSVDVAVTGTVHPECSIANPNDVTFATININQSAGADALDFSSASQSNTQQIYVSCNYAAKLTAASDNDGLLNEDGAYGVDGDTLAGNDSEFTNLIPYRVELSSTDGSFPELDFRTRASGNSLSVNAGGAFHNLASLKIYFDYDDTDKRPVAGTYKDRTVLTVGPV